MPFRPTCPRQVLRALPRPTAIVLASLVASASCPAQFLDIIKDKAAQALRKQLDGKPAETPASASAAPAPGAAPTDAGPALQAYQGYDFVPGDTIVFEDDFETDADGEFPAHWNQLDGQGAVNLVAGRKAFAMTADSYTQVSPAIKPAQYLGDAWTLEFDAYATDGGPHPRIYFYNADQDKHGYSQAVAELRLGWNNWSDIVIRGPEPQISQRNPDFMQRKDFLNRWHHFALAYKEGRLKIYVDQFRVYALQDLKARPRALAFDSSGEQSHPDVITNVRIANGAGIKVVDKKFTDAKIVTHGIHFDHDKATLRPESMGTLNTVAEILKNNPDLRFEIQGHTDNVGNAAHNRSLSQQRAEAVKQQLTAMGVAASRLATSGLGDSRPLADNATPEGRANNRRVEFVAIR
ncbi:MAG: OmpA family protein [Burkholderiales bacterium]|nr:OmpA family protein [Burkholderiales bacterium]